MHQAPFASPFRAGVCGMSIILDKRSPRKRFRGEEANPLCGTQIVHYIGNMSRVGWHEDNVLSIGRTPLVRLNRVQGRRPVTLLAKIEGRNPAYSVKCRLGAALVWDAERRGLLGAGKELVEPTSGNTGIALSRYFEQSGAAVAAAVRIAERPEHERKTLVVVLPDSGERYLSTSLFEGISDREGKAP